jgi:hypothetical protein
VHRPHRDDLARAAEGLPWRRWLRRGRPRNATAGQDAPARAASTTAEVTLARSGSSMM